MASLNERLEAEDAAPFVPFKDDRVLTEFEKRQLAADPTRPIYQDYYHALAQDESYTAWLYGCRSRSRSIPVTVVALAERPRAEGQP